MRPRWPSSSPGRTTRKQAPRRPTTTRSATLTWPPPHSPSPPSSDVATQRGHPPCLRERGGSAAPAAEPGLRLLRRLGQLVVDRGPPLVLAAGPLARGDRLVE